MKEELGYIECTKHGRVLSYAVCIHVLQGTAPIDLIHEPTPEMIGAIVCYQCAERPENDQDPEQYRLACIGCARDKGWIPRA